MNTNTAVRRSILSSLDLTKVITKKMTNKEVLINGSIENRTKAVYMASVSDGAEYAGLTIHGRTESDALNKLNDAILARFKKNHNEDYERIVRNTHYNIED